MIVEAARGAQSPLQVAKRLGVHHEQLKRAAIRFGIDLPKRRPGRLTNDRIAILLKAHGRRPVAISRVVGCNHSYVCRRLEEYEAQQ